MSISLPGNRQETKEKTRRWPAAHARIDILNARVPLRKGKRTGFPSACPLIIFAVFPDHLIKNMSVAHFHTLKPVKSLSDASPIGSDGDSPDNHRTRTGRSSDNSHLGHRMKPVIPIVYMTSSDELFPENFYPIFAHE
jgi:hypothetical protein